MSNLGIASKRKSPVNQGFTGDWDCSKRRERDSNPRRCDPQRFSRPPQSTTLPSLLSNVHSARLPNDFCRLQCKINTFSPIFQIISTFSSKFFFSPPYASYSFPLHTYPIPSFLRNFLRFCLVSSKSFINFASLSGGYQSGQMGQTVNLLAYAFGGSNPSLPTKIAEVAQLIEH